MKTSSSTESPSIFSTLFGSKPFKGTKQVSFQNEPQSSSGVKGYLQDLSFGEISGYISGGIAIVSGFVASLSEGGIKAVALGITALTAIGGAVNWCLGFFNKEKTTNNLASAEKLFNKHAQKVEENRQYTAQFISSGNDTEIREETGKLKEGSVAMLMYGPSGCGKTSTSKVLGDLIKQQDKESTGKDSEVETYIIRNDFYDVKMTDDILGKGKPVDRIRLMLLRATELAKQTGKKHVIIFDEMPPKFFQGDDKGHRTDECNEITLMLEEFRRDTKDVAAVFTCNMNIAEISPHLLTGGRRLRPFSFDFPSSDRRKEFLLKVISDRTQNSSHSTHIKSINKNDLEKIVTPPQCLIDQRTKASTFGDGTYDSEIREFAEGLEKSFNELSYTEIEDATTKALARSDGATSKIKFLETLLETLSVPLKRLAQVRLNRRWSSNVITDNVVHQLLFGHS